VLDGGPYPHGKGQFFGERVGHYKVPVQGHSAVTCAKTAEPMVMPFVLWAWTGPRSHELDGVQIPIRRCNFWGKGRPL